MSNKIMVKNFLHIKSIVDISMKYKDFSVGIVDSKGNMADGRSVIGLMSLNFNYPVEIICESEECVNTIINAIMGC